MRMVVFGPGFAGETIARAAEGAGGAVVRVGRAADQGHVAAALAVATHVVSTVPPQGDADPILLAHREAIARVPWIGYLSSTGVYGDAGGAWVDEGAALNGRRANRIAADLAWGAIGARVFRLPGIYGPGRSVLDRILAGQAHRVDMAHQVFSRIHVQDIARAVMAAAQDGPAGVYNIADDLPASQNALVEWGCAALGVAPPPLRSVEAAGLSPMARAFYAENRRVANGKARRLLGWRPLFPTYFAGLRALIATTRPAITSRPPRAASTDQT